MARTIVSLEITEESVRAVEVTTGRAPALVAAGEMPLPSGAARDSLVLDPRAVAGVLAELWSRAGIRRRRVVLGMGGPGVVVREFSTPTQRPATLRQMLPVLAGDVLPMPVSDAVLDYFPFAEADGQLRGLLVAAQLQTIDGLVSTLAMARLSVDTIDVVPFGLARLSSRLGRLGDATAMVHVGDHTSYVVVAVDGVPQFVSIVPVDIPTSAARVRAHAAAVRPTRDREFVLAGSAATAAAPRTASGGSAAVPAVVALADRVRSALSFYRNRPGAARISTVCVSGAGMAAEGVRGELARVLDVSPQTVTAHAIVSLRGAVGPSMDLDLNLVSTIAMTMVGSRR
ncbi:MULTISPECIES: type IV pilus biogenesis protein PilM [unclassified Microbacterium]|uniref:type IV pilus biogenesis protein PilM n=1 Tax=unclassified Microbacterium TaxID=2609290 RepID=UPI0012FE1F0B|nr:MULTISPECIES: pilus assembly protein PilM [unclassified Microbacterium]